MLDELIMFRCSNDSSDSKTNGIENKEEEQYSKKTHLE